MAKILHIARKVKNSPSNIHPQKWFTALERCWQDASQMWVHCDPPLPKNYEPKVTIVHGLNARPHIASKVRDAYHNTLLVGVSYNQFWYTPRIDTRILDAFNLCDLTFGKSPVGIEDPVNTWVEVGHLIDETIFFYAPGIPKTVDIICPRGWNNSPLYWGESRDRALEDHSSKTIQVLDGKLAPNQVSQLLRKSKCAVCLREDSGPSYAVVEACLSGCIPIVSDCPSIRADFKDGGAFFATNTPESISLAISRCLNMSDEERQCWIDRNVEYFKNSTMRVQGAKIVEEIKKKLTQ